MEPRRIRRLTLLFLVLVVLAGLLVRLAYLSQPMRLDESANYILLASKSLLTCVTRYPEANNHPLHTVLVHLCARVLGNAPWCLRMPAFVAGVLVIPATYAAFEELFDGSTALVAAALVVPSVPLVEYSTNARGYSLQTLFFVSLVFVTAKVIHHPTRRRWGGLVLLSVLGFYTIPSMLYFFGAMVVWVVLSAALGDTPVPKKRVVAQLAGASGAVVAIVGLLYLPFILTDGLPALTSNRWVRPLSWLELRDGLPGALVRYAESWHRGLPVVASVVLVAGFVVSLVVFRRMSAFRVNPTIVTLATCLAVMMAQRVLPPERVLLPCVPLYLGSCAAGLRWIAGRVAARIRERDARLLGDRSAPILTAALALVAAVVPGAIVLADGAAYQTPDQVLFRDAETIALVLKEILRDGDVVYVQRDATYVLAYYFVLHDIPSTYLYAPGARRRAVGRAFTVDASADDPAFTYRTALSDSDLAKGREVELSPIVQLPHSAVYRVLGPELVN